MRELQARWKQVALAPRAQGEAMWRRFKTAQDEVFTRTSAHLAAQNEERAANLAQKQALCERAEALADSIGLGEDGRTRFRRCRPNGRRSAPSRRGHEKAVWERFRAACDRFFTRRQEDLKQRKDEWAANLAQQGSALRRRPRRWPIPPTGTHAAAQLKQLQAEWKTIGPVRKSKSEAVWQRFRAACDRFFDRYKHRDQVELQEKAGRARDGHPRARRRCCRPNGNAAGDAPDDLYHDRAGRAHPVAAGARAAAQPCSRIWPPRYHQAHRPAGRRLAGGFCGHRSRPRATRKRMEKLLAKVEELLPSRSSARRRAQLSPAELLARAMARAARRQHDRGRPRGRRERRGPLARCRAGSPQRAVAVDAPRTRAGRGRRAAQRAFPARRPASFYDSRREGVVTFSGQFGSHCIASAIERNRTIRRDSGC